MVSSGARGNRVRWKVIRGMFNVVLLAVVCCVLEVIYDCFEEGGIVICILATEICGI